MSLSPIIFLTVYYHFKTLIGATFRKTENKVFKRLNEIWTKKRT